MKKIGILNKEISEVVAGMGHTDMLVVADAGLPIPPGVRRIDLALKGGLPSFSDTVRVILSELQVEQFILAEETCQVSPHVATGLRDLLPGVPVRTVSHEQFKQLCGQAVAIVRTGEFTPYANVIFVSGVVF